MWKKNQEYRVQEAFLCTIFFPTIFFFLHKAQINSISVRMSLQLVMMLWKGGWGETYILLYNVFFWSCCNHLHIFFLSLVAHQVKNLPAMQETRVWSIGQEDALEKGMTTHSSILAWRIVWIEEPGGLQFMGSQRVSHDWMTNTVTFIFLSKLWT